MTGIAERLEAVRNRVTSAAIRAGRNPDDIELVAVSKTHPPEAVREALEAGQTLFGESRVQEARAKIPLVAGRARWHFIGHLQKNKIRQALPLFELIHGVDSLELARAIDQTASVMGFHPAGLLEINVAGESTKHGFSPETVRRDLDELIGLERLQIEGLMCIPPPGPEPEISRRFFVALRELRDQLENEFAIGLPRLSMGMSGDYEIAIEEGATMVRVGTAIFGPRSGKAFRPAADEVSLE
jgi:pyridoxal phosphate enzyme (YggS family)